MKKIVAILATIGALSGGIAVATTTGAAEPYGPAGLSVTPSSPTSPGTLTVTLDGCRPNAPMSATFDSGDSVAADADANGTAVVQLSVPSGLTVGSSHTVTASCTDVDGAAVTESKPVTIAASATTMASGQHGGSAGTGNGTGSTDSLPATGSNIALPLTALGLALVLAGGGIWLMSRRRRVRGI